MTRYVITPDVAVELVERGQPLAADVALVAPTLLRSQVLTSLYRRVTAGELELPLAKRYLDDIRALSIRLLGDRVLQGRAWRIAAELGWPDTYDAEYVALTQLQADALVTGDATLRATVERLVATADVEALIRKEV
jgi:predicted nucleic acid-binding protein